MRTSSARLLILIALCLVILVELRTVLAFFEIYLSITETLVIGAVAVALLLVWAFRPAGENVE